MVIAILAAAALAMTPEEVTIPGPGGPIAGTLTDPGDGAPALILIAGSGPTDRNGDSPLGIRGGAYKQLAEGLAEQGVATIRYDKRGMFGSATAIPNANKVTFDDYAADAHGWIALMRERGHDCVWLGGHSEGSTVAQFAAQNPDGICGLILISGAGRPILDVMEAQFSRQLPPAMMAQASAAIAQLKAGEEVDASALPGPLQPMFTGDIAAFMASSYTIDPADLLPGINVPILIVQGTEDLQVAISEGERMKAVKPEATLITLDGVNHAMKNVPPGNPAANIASYGDAEMKIDPRLAESIASFIKAH